MWNSQRILEKFCVHLKNYFWIISITIFNYNYFSEWNSSFKRRINSWKSAPLKSGNKGSQLELVSKELNHFRVIAGLFWQIGGHSSRFLLFCSFWRLFTIKIIKSVKVFPFSFWKIITFFFLLHEIQTPGINMQNGRQVI